MIKQQTIPQDYKFAYVKNARSVSSLVSSIQVEFDPTGSKLRRAAKNQGLTTEDVQAQWNAKGSASRSLGSDLHEHIAGILRNEEPDPIEVLSTQHPHIRVFNRFWKRASKNFQVVWVEKTIASQKYNITGRVDAMLFDSSTRQHHLIDWKSGKYSTHGWDSLLPPFDDMRSSSPDLGAVQLGVYRLAVEDALNIELGRSYVGYVSDVGMTMRRVDDIGDRLERWLSG